MARTGTASQTSTYGYNALEQMVTRVTTAPGGPAGTLHYIYDGQGHLIAEADGATGATLREYIWLASNDNAPVDLPLALVTSVNTATPVLSMVHADHLGRPIRMTNASRATVWQAFYNPWGEPYGLSGSIENNLRFPGQFFLIETGLAYNWHRHYDPTTGRYTQADPLRFVDGPSVYAYAGASPFTNVDRDGLCHIWPCSPRPVPPGPFGIPQPHSPGIGDALGGLWDGIVAMCASLFGGGTGDCDEDTHRKLQDEVDYWCGRPGRCSDVNLSEHDIISRITNNSQCINAREAINKQCFKGGDAGHNQAIDERKKALARCNQRSGR